MKKANLSVLCATLLLALAPASGAGEVTADPAVWGPYAQWVEKTFVRQEKDSQYGAHKVSYAWEEPGKVIIETGYYASGEVWFTQFVSPGKEPGQLVTDLKPGPKGAWNIVDSQTLASNKFFGYQTLRRATGEGGYEEQTVKGGEVRELRTYLDTASARYLAQEAQKSAEEAQRHADAITALRTLGVPEEAAVPAPAERLLAYQEPVRGPSGELRLTRGKASGRCHMAVYINNRMAARFTAGETATFRVPAGTLRVSLGPDATARSSCAIAESGKVEHVTRIGRGEQLHVHFGGQGAAVRFSESLAAQTST